MRTHARGFLSRLAESLNETTFPALDPFCSERSRWILDLTRYTARKRLDRGTERIMLTRNFHFTSVELLPQPLPKLLRVLYIVPTVRRVLHCPSRIFRVHQRREAHRYRRPKWLQGPHYKVSDKASFLKCLFPKLAVRRLDLERAV